MIRITGLTKRFGALHVLRGLDLDEELRKAEEFGNRVTKGIPIERLKEIFGL